jgi:hypothetical protein
MSDVQSFYGDPPDDVDKPKWTPIQVSATGITVSWQEKYGALKTATCIGLWENATQYMLSYRDKESEIIEKENVDDMKVEEK